MQSLIEEQQMTSDTEETILENNIGRDTALVSEDNGLNSLTSHENFASEMDTDAGFTTNTTTNYHSSSDMSGNNSNDGEQRHEQQQQQHLTFQEYLNAHPEFVFIWENTTVVRSRIRGFYHHDTQMIFQYHSCIEAILLLQQELSIIKTELEANYERFMQACFEYHAISGAIMDTEQWNSWIITQEEEFEYQQQTYQQGIFHATTPPHVQNLLETSLGKLEQWLLSPTGSLLQTLSDMVNEMAQLRVRVTLESYQDFQSREQSLQVLRRLSVLDQQQQLQNLDFCLQSVAISQELQAYQRQQAQQAFQMEEQQLLGTEAYEALFNELVLASPRTALSDEPQLPVPNSSPSTSYDATNPTVSNSNAAVSLGTPDALRNNLLLIQPFTPPEERLAAPEEYSSSEQDFSYTFTTAHDPQTDRSLDSMRLYAREPNGDNNHPPEVHPLYIDTNAGSRVDDSSSSTATDDDTQNKILFEGNFIDKEVFETAKVLLSMKNHYSKQ